MCDTVRTVQARGGVTQSVDSDESDEERGCCDPRDGAWRRLLRPDDGGRAHSEGIQGGRGGAGPRLQAAPHHRRDTGIQWFYMICLLDADASTYERSSMQVGKIIASVPVLVDV